MICPIHVAIKCQSWEQFRASGSCQALLSDSPKQSSLAGGDHPPNPMCTIAIKRDVWRPLLDIRSSTSVWWPVALVESIRRASYTAFLTKCNEPCHLIRLKLISSEILPAWNPVLCGVVCYGIYNTDPGGSLLARYYMPPTVLTSIYYLEWISFCVLGLELKLSPVPRPSRQMEQNHLILEKRLMSILFAHIYLPQTLRFYGGPSGVEASGRA